MEVESKESLKKAEKEQKKGKKPKNTNSDTPTVGGLEFSLDEIKSKTSVTTPGLEFSLQNSKKKKKVKQNSDEEAEAGDQVYKPGQKHREPPHDDPLRAFYESLYEQNPNSQMAQKYCLENGLLSEDAAKKVLKKVKSSKKSK